ncbi:hypothetical protein U1Q18_034392, partial [Sarracenia purpurea var. burkii]
QTDLHNHKSPIISDLPQVDMDDKSITTTVAVTVPTAAGNDQKPPLHGENINQKKKASGFSLIKAAMLMVRGRPNAKPKPLPVKVASKGTLEKIVGSMRPLHLQDNQSPPPSVQRSPLPSPDWDSSSSVDSMSQYGSAINLQELDKGGDDQIQHVSSTNLQQSDYKGSDSDSGYESSTNLQQLNKGSSSQCASSTNLQELDKGLSTRRASSPNLEELDKGLSTQRASSPNVEELGKGSNSPSADSAPTTNLQELDKGLSNIHASPTNLQELNKLSSSRCASSPNLQELDKGSSRRCASSMNLQELERGSRDGRYARAMNLLELDLKGESDEDDDDESDEKFDDKGGDEMIDAKAEEFIAKFYNQMKIQHLKSVERYNIHKNKMVAKQSR